MTPQEKAANVAMLARVVMNYEPVAGFLWKFTKFIGTSKTVPFVWDPYTSIADAMEMLDRAEWFDLEKRISYECDIWIAGRVARFHGDGVTIQDAICAACLEWAKAQPPAPEPEQGRVEGGK